MIIALSVMTVYLAATIWITRASYRREYKLIYGSPAPMVYGGKNGHEIADRYAMREAMRWAALWPLFLCWAGLGWLISHGSTQDWVERDNELSRAEWEIRQLEAQQDPLKQVDEETEPEQEPCPCGYVTECPIHCGDGSKCHEPEIIVTKHPEQVINLGGDWITPDDYDWPEYRS